MPVSVQIRYWPWSIPGSDQKETINIGSGVASFQFWGSPVVCISSRARLFLPRRHELIRPFGPAFITRDGEYSLYEMPHGILASSPDRNALTESEIQIHFDGNRDVVKLDPVKAVPRFYSPTARDQETPLARTVVAWSQFFDDLQDEAKKSGRVNSLPWAKAVKSIFDISEDPQQPRKSLIVHIAELMRSRIAEIVAAIRRILNRERLLVRAGTISEVDTTCVRWLVRQPGNDLVQKAASNRQRLLGVTRRESFDTLENRVLKDFLARCSIESLRYHRSEIGENAVFFHSERAKTVRQYRQICTDLLRTALFDSIAAPPPAVRPNYVLQNDLRYREVWRHYTRLLKREDEEDCLWDWQARTWADVCRFLVCAAIYRMAQEGSKRLLVEELLRAAVCLRGEQQLGSRVLAGSEPGPFLISKPDSGRSRSRVLEIVHPDQATNHPATKLLGRTGGHLYLVLSNPLGDRSLVVIIWAVHTAASEEHPSWDNIGLSAGRALLAHSHIMNELGDPVFPKLHGFVVASDIKAASADLHPGSGDALHLVQVATDQRCWEEALKGIVLVIEDILEAYL